MLNASTLRIFYIFTLYYMILQVLILEYTHTQKYQRDNLTIFTIILLKLHALCMIVSVFYHNVYLLYTVNMYFWLFWGNEWTFFILSKKQSNNFLITNTLYRIVLYQCPYYGSLSSIDHSLGVVISVTYRIWVDNITCLINV